MTRFARLLRSLIPLSRDARRGADVGALLRWAEDARTEGRWAEAAELYARIVQARPRRVGSRIQLGNMLKESGDLAGAERAYRDALALRPTVEAWSQLGYLLLVTGRPEAAADAFSSALMLQADFLPAREGMIRCGERDRLTRVAADPQTLSRLRSLVKAASHALDSISDAAIVPTAAYDAFRRQYPDLPPPPSGSVPRLLTVGIDARGASPHRVRATVLSLMELEAVDFTAAIVADEDLLAHPVASMALADARIRFVSAAEPADVIVEAGAILDAKSLAWLSFAWERTGAEVIFADHDHHVQSVSGVSFSQPVLFPSPDADLLATTASLPPVVMVRGAARHARMTKGLRSLLVDAAATGRAAHVPLVLSSILEASPAELRGLPAPTEVGPGFFSRVTEEPIMLGLPDDGRAIRVIVPTRDEAALLESCLSRLRSTSARPERVRVTVVDNRSRTPELAAYLAAEEKRGRISVVPADEPFNWSRLNRLGVEATDEPCLLFLNNDTEMITFGWDQRLVSQLSRPEIGVVGARLIYPDGTLQHGGVVFGLADGAPRHEGVGARLDDGPSGRWRATRSVSAVTGAYLGVRRDVFLAVGGFDETRLAVAYNDIDFCLRCREAGFRVLYDGSVEVLHHESKTRGMNDSRGRLAWDSGEFRSLHDRWGEALHRDPAVNPHWATRSIRPFDGLRAVPADEAVAWIERSFGRAWLP